MFRRLGLSLLLLFLTASPVAAGKPPAKAAPPAKSLLDGLELYSFDAPHSEIGFSVAWMGISRVHGSFEDILGSIAFDQADPTRSAVFVVIQTKSIDTNFDRRDKDLRSANFFDVEKFPTITFRSREIVRSGDDYLARGPLTIHGVTKEIEIPMKFNGRVSDARGDQRVGFEGHLTLNRKDYGVVGPPNLNLVLDKGIIVGEQVDIPLAVEGWRAVPHDSIPDRAADSLYRVVLAHGAGMAGRQYRELKAKTVDSLMTVDEGVINTVGYQLLQKDRPAEALEIFRLETESWPTNVFGYVGMGQTYATLGNRDLAISTLEKAIALNPGSPRAQVLLMRLRG